LETENVAGQMEGSDLTASVHQDLVGAHRPANDLVEVIGGLVLPVDLGIGGKRHARTPELEPAGLQGGTPEPPAEQVAFPAAPGNHSAVRSASASLMTSS